MVALAFGHAYPTVAKHLATSLFHWVGDANTYQPKDGAAFVEFVTSPNNPCHSHCNKVAVGAAAKQRRKLMVHDMSYHWPSFTAVIKACKHNLMIFTLAKCTSPAGMHLA